MRTITIKAAALFALSMLFVLSASAAPRSPKPRAAARWSEDRANAWYAAQPWLSGCNYIPSNAINQIEMWSRETYDRRQIDKELGWAEELGFNTMRVFLSSVVYQHDPAGLKKRIGDFLDICARHGIRPFFVFFDDCWAAESHYGKQPAPIPGTHNSGWVCDPSKSLRTDTVTLYRNLSRYVKDIIAAHRNDKRVLMWDLFNEPTPESLALLRKVYQWAREVNPSQPLTSGLSNFTAPFSAIDAFDFDNADVITYHNYQDPAAQMRDITFLRAFNRPLICTEYMARPRNSKFTNIMPLLKENNVGAVNWGFVSGKTNTIYAWGTPIPDGSEPKVWFHDIIRPDKTPFDPAEIEAIKKCNAKR